MKESRFRICLREMLIGFVPIDKLPYKFELLPLLKFRGKFGIYIIKYSFQCKQANRIRGFYPTAHIAFRGQNFIICSSIGGHDEAPPTTIKQEISNQPNAVSLCMLVERAHIATE